METLRSQEKHVQMSILGNSSRTDGHRWQARKKHNEGKPAGETGLDELPAQLGAEPHTRPRRNRPSWPCRVFLALGQSPVFNFHQPKSDSTFVGQLCPDISCKNIRFLQHLLFLGRSMIGQDRGMMFALHAVRERAVSRSRNNFDWQVYFRVQILNKRGRGKYWVVQLCWRSWNSVEDWNFVSWLVSPNQTLKCQMES